MLYLDYVIEKEKYIDAIALYEQILSEKERLFAMTQPKSLQFDRERVKGGKPMNSFEEYLIEKERKHIDARIEEVKSLRDERHNLLMVKELDLRMSKDLHDRIYVLKYLDKVRVHQIAIVIGYSDSQVYRIIESMERKIKLATKCEKKCGISEL